MLVTNLRAALKSPDDLRCYNTVVHIRVCLMLKGVAFINDVLMCILKQCNITTKFQSLLYYTRVLLIPSLVYNSKTFHAPREN